MQASGVQHQVGHGVGDPQHAADQPSQDEEDTDVLGLGHAPVPSDPHRALQKETQEQQDDRDDGQLVASDAGLGAVEGDVGVRDELVPQALDLRCAVFGGPDGLGVAQEVLDAAVQVGLFGGKADGVVVTLMPRGGDEADDGGAEGDEEDGQGGFDPGEGPDGTEEHHHEWQPMTTVTMWTTSPEVGAWQAQAHSHCSSRWALETASNVGIMRTTTERRRVFTT